MLANRRLQSQTSVMKAVPGVFKALGLVAGIITSLIIFACSHLKDGGGPDNRHNVVIGTYYIDIPGTPISENDQKTLNAKLNHAGDHLYKIHEFKGGQFEKSKGTLQHINLAEQIIAGASENAKTTRLTGWAIRVGDPYFEGHAPDGTHRHAMGAMGQATGSHRIHVGPTPNGSHRNLAAHAPSGTHRQVNKEEAAALVNELQPILEKYKAR
jgi:hypothetical protein